MFFTPECEKGQRIIEFLRKELDLPTHLLGFSLHIKNFTADKDEGIITVKDLCYYPEDDKPEAGKK